MHNNPEARPGPRHRPDEGVLRNGRAGTIVLGYLRRPTSPRSNAKLTATMPDARRPRQPGAVLTLGGGVPPLAPMCANTGQLWRASCRLHGLVFLGGTLLARRASQRKAHKSMKTW